MENSTVVRIHCLVDVHKQFYIERYSASIISKTFPFQPPDGLECRFIG